MDRQTLQCEEPAVYPLLPAPPPASDESVSCRVSVLRTLPDSSRPKGEKVVETAAANTNTLDGIVSRRPRGELHHRPPRRLEPLDHDNSDELFHGEHPYVDLESRGDILVWSVCRGTNSPRERAIIGRAARGRISARRHRTSLVSRHYPWQDMRAYSRYPAPQSIKRR